jgi:hypothetical protein
MISSGRRNLSTLSKFYDTAIKQPPRKEVEEGKGVEWEQAAPGRYFVQMKHEKGQRWSGHAFDEVLITEQLEGIPACFEQIEEVTMEASCPSHSGGRWICELWRKIACE